MSAPRPHRATPVADPVVGAHDHAHELNGERKLGRSLPLTEGLGLLADYLAGLRAALKKPPLHAATAHALPFWESYVRGVRERVDQLGAENRPARRNRP